MAGPGAVSRGAVGEPVGPLPGHRLLEALDLAVGLRPAGPRGEVAGSRAAAEVGIDPERVRGVLAAIAPIVGTARVASATATIAEALAIEIEIAELKEQGVE